MATLPKQDGLDYQTQRAFGGSELTEKQIRHLKILNHLNSTGIPASTTDLWEVVGTDKVTKRQLQRDLDDMVKIYDIVCSEQGRSKYWAAKHGCTLRFVLPVLDENAALAFHLAEDLLQKVLPDNVIGSLKPWFAASKKLLIDSSDHGDWYERVTSKREGIQLIPPEIDSKVLATVYQALRSKQDLKITHVKATGEQKEHLVSPAGIAASNQTLYLLTFSPKHKDYTTYAMHRISQAKIGYTPVTVPAVPHLLKYVDGKLNEFIEGDGVEIPLVLDFDPVVQRKMLEYKLGKDMHTEALRDGWLRVQSNMFETGSLHAWLLSYGNRVRVIAPRKLVMKLNAMRQPAPRPPRPAPAKKPLRN